MANFTNGTPFAMADMEHGPDCAIPDDLKSLSMGGDSENFVQRIRLADRSDVWRSNGHNFVFVPRLSSTPLWHLDSFLLERNIRKRWWIVKKDEVAMDVGSAYGSYSLPALESGASVISFEPDRFMFCDLIANVLINPGFHERFKSFNVLAGERFGETGKYFLKSHTSGKGDGPSEDRLICSIDSILLGVLKIFRLDWVKVDVEGDELSVVNGAMESLKRFHPKLLIENHEAIFPQVRQEIAKVLLSLGYTEQDSVGSPGTNDNWSLWK